MKLKQYLKNWRCRTMTRIEAVQELLEEIDFITNCGCITKSESPDLIVALRMGVEALLREEKNGNEINH
jgi:hypothetical protein